MEIVVEMGEEREKGRDMRCKGERAKGRRSKNDEKIIFHALVEEKVTP